MELLQTIWNALTNENEVLMNIVSVPCTILEVYLYTLLFTTILKIQSSNKQKILFVAILSAISLFNTFLGIAPFNNIINVIVFPLLIILIYKTRILKAVLSQITVYILVVIVSVLAVSLYSGILNITIGVCSIIPIHRICVSILMYLGLFLIYRLCKKHDINISLFENLNHANTAHLILNFIIGSIGIGFEYYLLFNYIDYIPHFLVFLSLFFMSFYFALSIYSLLRTNDLEKTTQKLEEEKMYNKTLNTLHDNIRGFKHDFNNIVQAIGGYLSTNNIDGLKTYYKDLLEECQINNNLAVLNPELVNNPAIYSLLADKLEKAEKDHIKLNYEVMTDLSNLNIKTYELTRILCILFDNALEAASKCDKKIVNVSFRADKNHRNRTLVIIQNTYTNKDVNVDRIFEKGYTSKTDGENHQNHGLGLWEVRKYLKKNTNLDLYTTKNDMFFTQQFEIYN